MNQVVTRQNDTLKLKYEKNIKTMVENISFCESEMQESKL